jgi:hypothetical protein
MKIELILLALFALAVTYTVNPWLIFYAVDVAWNWLSDLRHFYSLVLLLGIVVLIRRWWRMTEGA